MTVGTMQPRLQSEPAKRRDPAGAAATAAAELASAKAMAPPVMLFCVSRSRSIDAAAKVSRTTATLAR